MNIAPNIPRPNIVSDGPVGGSVGIGVICPILFMVIVFVQLSVVGLKFPLLSVKIA